MTASIKNLYASLIHSPMKQTMFLTYKTDTWHTHESRELIGVCSNIGLAVNVCHLRAIKENQQIDSEQLDLLHRILQTQNYSGEGEFFIEEQPIDILL